METAFDQCMLAAEFGSGEAGIKENARLLEMSQWREVGENDRLEEEAWKI